jgi:GAG-pre-integrase domain
LKKGVIFNDQDQGLARVETTPNSHFLKVVKEPMFIKSAMHTTIIKPKPLELWHCRLMHSSNKNVKETAKLTKGILIQEDSNSEDQSLCRECNLANSIRNVSRDAQLRRKDVFKLVYVKIEKITPIGYNGHA